MLQILKSGDTLKSFHLYTKGCSLFYFSFGEFVFSLELTCLCYCRPLLCRLPLASAQPELWPGTEESTCQRHPWRRTPLRTPARRTHSSGWPHRDRKKSNRWLSWNQKRIEENRLLLSVARAQTMSLAPVVSSIWKQLQTDWKDNKGPRQVFGRLCG